MKNYSHPMKKNYHTSEDFFTSSPDFVTYLWNVRYKPRNSFSLLKFIGVI